MSMPMTSPSGPTIFAAMRESMPAPQPTSTIRSPGANAPRLNGFPVPANDSMGPSGIPSSHSAR